MTAVGDGEGPRADREGEERLRERLREVSLLALERQAAEADRRLELMREVVRARREGLLGMAVTFAGGLSTMWLVAAVRRAFGWGDCP